MDYCCEKASKLLASLPFGLRWWTLGYRIMDYYRENVSKLLNRLPFGLGMRPCPTIVPLSRFLGSPAPQTSLSTGSHISSLDPVLTSFHSFRTSKRAHLFHSLTSAQTHSSPVPMHGSASQIDRGSVIATISGCDFYNR